MGLQKEDDIKLFGEKMKILVNTNNTSEFYKLYDIVAKHGQEKIDALLQENKAKVIEIEDFFAEHLIKCREDYRVKKINSLYGRIGNLLDEVRGIGYDISSLERCVRDVFDDVEELTEKEDAENNV